MTDPLGLIPNQGVSPLQNKQAAQSARPIQGPQFKEVMLQQIEQVNKLQQEAQFAVEDLASGRGNEESVFMAKQKADIAFQMLLQVRNKLMDAYDEVKQIRV
ncbi:MAG: flagellar hook-basal body complex protein FliE [Planctomycetota bacterium]